MQEEALLKKEKEQHCIFSTKLIAVIVVEKKSNPSINVEENQGSFDLCRRPLRKLNAKQR
jgi:hypothetical protein